MLHDVMNESMGSVKIDMDMLNVENVDADSNKITTEPVSVNTRRRFAKQGPGINGIQAEPSSQVIILLDMSSCMATSMLRTPMQCA